MEVETAGRAIPVIGSNPMALRSVHYWIDVRGRDASAHLVSVESVSGLLFPVMNDWGLRAVKNVIQKRERDISI